MLWLLALSSAAPAPKVTQRVFFDIEANNVSLGRLVLGLYGEFAPKAVENFYHLSVCDRGPGRSGVDRCYKWVRFHHIIQDVQMQAGDYILGTGGVSESIWGDKFADDNLTALHHTGPGILTMANSGKNSNGSQFIITLKPTEWLDGRHQIFGRVMTGWNVLAAMSARGSQKGRPTERVVIAECGPI
jgi:peptidylprolyl isomerase